jgi:hypothetical protein
VLMKPLSFDHVVGQFVCVVRRFREMALQHRPDLLDRFD